VKDKTQCARDYTKSVIHDAVRWTLGEHCTIPAGDSSAEVKSLSARPRAGGGLKNGAWTFQSNVTLLAEFYFSHLRAAACSLAIDNREPSSFA